MHDEGMSKWQVLKLVKPNGNVPYDKWANDLSVADKAKVDQALDAIEGVTQIPPEKVKKYLDLYEIKIYGKGKAFRPLAIKDGDNRIIILLIGTTKKGKIPPHEYEAALKLANLYQGGGCNVKRYWEA